MDVGTPKSQQSRIKSWVGAMRLRTLPLALASTIVGSGLALMNEAFDWQIALLTALTTVLLQINSNLANDYGDFQKGTDNDDRIGPERALQSGMISAASMKKAIVLFSLMSLASGIALLWRSEIETTAKGVLFIAGCAAIYASIKYTAGSNPYGYRGLGDLSVMVFFGILGVYGAYFVQVGTMDWLAWLPALSIGMLSAGVLNVNNTRDLEPDRSAGKITLAVKLGPQGARIYHVALLSTALLLFVLFGAIRFQNIYQWLFLIGFPLIVFNAFKVFAIREATQLDPYLKQLALSTFLLAFLFALGQAI